MRKNKRITKFLMRYELLVTYAEREGHAYVPVTHIESGFHLGRWVAAQRSHYSANKLEQQNIALLEALKGWVWRASDYGWEKGVEALKQFYLREGHIFVPNNHIENRFALGEWLSKQRRRLRNKRLTPKQVKELTAFGPMEGNWREQRNRKRWEDRFQTLKNYTEQHGTSLVPRHHIEDGIALGVWVNSLRSQRSRGVLEEDLAQRLEALPKWVWAKARQQAQV